MESSEENTLQSDTSGNVEEDAEDDQGLEVSNTKYVIEQFFHRVRDIQDCAKQYIPAAIKRYNGEARRLREGLAETRRDLDEEKDEATTLATVKRLRQLLATADRHISSRPVETLEKSLFVNLFAAFDKYVGDLVAVLYHREPRLYNSINREISLSEALQYGSIGHLREAVLDKEIEALRRKSYAQQFGDLETRFSIKLTKFEAWPAFIECAQRRNLFTHCDGVVSKQYLDACREVGYSFKNKPDIGVQLKIGPKYFYWSCFLVLNVAVMLGHTLWRKVLPDELEKADSHLTSLIFDLLQIEMWPNAIALSKFALGLPKISTDQMERIYTVNYAIALRAIRNENAARNVLDKKDWTATTYDFALAYAILTAEYGRAGEIMIKMGKEGALIDELSYHDWPLFREFRDTEEFLSSYEKVYGYKYISKLSEISGKKQGEVDTFGQDEDIEDEQDSTDADDGEKVVGPMESDPTVH